MVDHSPRRASYRGVLLLLVVPLVALFACTDHCANQICQSDTPARAIEDLCGGSTGMRNCQTKGDARATVGITEDSHGFELGPSGGAVAMHLDGLPGNVHQGVLDIDVLVAAAPSTSGSALITTFAPMACTVGGCLPPPPPLRHDVTDDVFVWVNVAKSSNVLSLGPDVVMTFAGTNLQIADVRVHSTFSQSPINCSVAGPVGL